MSAIDQLLMKIIHPCSLLWYFALMMGADCAAESLAVYNLFLAQMETHELFSDISCGENLKLCFLAMVISRLGLGIR